MSVVSAGVVGSAAITAGAGGSTNSKFNWGGLVSGVIDIIGNVTQKPGVGGVSTPPINGNQTLNSSLGLGKDQLPILIGVGLLLFLIMKK